MWHYTFEIIHSRMYNEGLYIRYTFANLKGKVIGSRLYIRECIMWHYTFKIIHSRMYNEGLYTFVIHSQKSRKGYRFKIIHLRMYNVALYIQDYTFANV